MASLINIFLDLIKKMKFLNFILKLLGYPRLDDIVVIRRFPPRKVLRALQLGLTFGLLSALLIICLNHSSLFAGLPWYTSPLIALLFILGTLLGGLFVIILGVFLLIFLFITIDPGKLAGILENICQWYFCGYAFGFIFAIVYNDLVLLNLLIFCKDSVKIAFAFDFKRKFNIIKSPYESEELALMEVLRPLNYYTFKISEFERTGGADASVVEEAAEEIISLIRKAYKKKTMTNTDKEKLLKLLECTSEDQFEQKLQELKARLAAQDKDWINIVNNEIEPLVEKYLKLRNSKLYNYQIEAPPVCPYTIAFIANPYIYRHDTSPIENDPDPIMEKKELFLRSVEKALYSLERNEVLGRPEIWSRIRVIAVFDKSLLGLRKADGTFYSLVQPFHTKVALDDNVVVNLIAPKNEIWTDYQDIVIKEYSEISGFSQDDLTLLNRQTDVIYILTDSKEFDRSSALFTDYEEDKSLSESEGKKFKYHVDPKGKKKGEVYLPIGANYKGRIKSKHENYAAIPGRIALNVSGSTIKSYIHEFAHAMSSAFNGAIVDEYFDKMQFENDTKKIEFPEKTVDFNEVKLEKSAGEMEKPDEDERIPFYVNRIERKESENGKVIPVHKIFAKYNEVIYYSDRNHPSSEENWVGYFPDRKSPYIWCTMDRTYGDYQFDKLISDFIYDRLIAKMNREK